MDPSKYNQYLKEVELEDLVKHLISLYLEPIPTNYWIGALCDSKEAVVKDIEDEGYYQTVHGPFDYRKDLSKLRWVIKLDKYHEPFVSEYILEFYEQVDLAEVIEDALSEQVYSKRETGEGVIYQIDNFKIGEIEIDPHRFKVTIDEANCDFIHKTPPVLEDINLEFLWAKKKGPVQGGPHPFWEKWDGEKQKYQALIQYGTLETIIRLLILSFVDRCPRDYWYVSLSKRMASSWNLKVEGGYELLDHQGINREDIIRHKWKTKKDLRGRNFDYERVFEFREDIDLTKVVEDSLSSKSFTKTIAGSKIIYQVKESPIGKIELKRRSFKMTTSQQYFLSRPWS